MSETMQGESEDRTRAFDPYEPDCFARWINKTNDEVSALLVSVAGRLAGQGEYDQGDVATLDWDDARDLVVVAEMLWAYSKQWSVWRPAPSGDTAQGDSEDRISRDRRLLAEAASLLMAVDTTAEGIQIPDGWFDQSNALLAKVREA